MRNLINHSINRILRRGAIPAVAVTALFCTVFPAFSEPLRVSEDDGRKAIVARVTPAVPPIARQAHLTGKVVIDMTVSEDGTVEKVDVVSGNPILGGACVSAGKKWTFKPFLADGKPCKAIVRASFEFGS